MTDPTGPSDDTDSGDSTGYPPISGPRRKWLEDWGASGTVMLGCILTAVAFLVRDRLWLWILAAVVLVAGAALWITAGAAAASRARH